jgi:alanine racemase
LDVHSFPTRRSSDLPEFNPFIIKLPHVTKPEDKISGQLVAFFLNGGNYTIMKPDAKYIKLIETAKLISEIAASINIIAKVHIKIDTGTSRLGIIVQDAADFIETCSKFSMIQVVGVFTHFADSENSDWTYTNGQIEKFRDLLFSLQRLNIKIPIPHAACSAAALISANSHFNMVRVGISTYGLWPSDKNKQFVQKKFPNFDLKPVLSWKTKIIQISKNLILKYYKIKSYGIGWSTN